MPRVQVINFLDIGKNPSAPDPKKGEKPARIMHTEDDDYEDDDKVLDEKSKKRLLKMVLRAETGQLFVAVEHEAGSIPSRIKEGEWLQLDESKVQYFHPQVAFLLNGALR